MHIGKIINENTPNLLQVAKAGTNELLAKYNLEELLSRFNPNDRRLLESGINEINAELVEPLVNAKNLLYPDGYDAYGIKMVLDTITLDNLPKAKNLISTLPPENNFLPYELVNMIEKSATDLNNSPQAYPLIRKSPMAENIIPQKNFFEDFFGHAFKKIYLEKSTKPNVLEIEKAMEDLGVKANFADDENTAKLIYQTCSKLKKQGIDLPKQILMMTPHDESILGFTPIMIKGFEKEAQIFLQKGLCDKTDFSDPLFKEFGLNHFAVESAEGTFLHELGHYVHLQDCLDDNSARIVWNKCVGQDMDYQMSLAKKCSAHAMTDDTGKEFVAEIFAGLSSGKKYDIEIMNIYNQLKGPAI